MPQILSIDDIPSLIDTKYFLLVPSRSPDIHSFIVFTLDLNTIIHPDIQRLEHTTIATEGMVICLKWQFVKNDIDDPIRDAKGNHIPNKHVAQVLRECVKQYLFDVKMKDLELADYLGL